MEDKTNGDLTWSIHDVGFHDYLALRRVHSSEEAGRTLRIAVTFNPRKTAADLYMGFDTHPAMKDINPLFNSFGCLKYCQRVIKQRINKDLTGLASGMDNIDSVMEFAHQMWDNHSVYRDSAWTLHFGSQTEMSHLHAR